MTDRYVYLSQEWAQEAYRRLRQDLTAEKMKYVTSSMVTLYKNCPDGIERSLYYKFEKGVIQAVSVLEGELPQADFIITGNYDVFASISRGELSSRSALMSGKLKLRGSMVKALSLSAVADRMNKVIGSIPTQY
jgi:putative sterol carrier protein